MRRHTKSAAQRFSPTDRRRLERALSTVREARLYRRIEAVLLVAEGQPISDAAQRVRATRLSVRRWVKRYLAAHDGKRQRCDAGWRLGLKVQGSNSSIRLMGWPFARRSSTAAM